MVEITRLAAVLLVSALVAPAQSVSSDWNQVKTIVPGAGIRVKTQAGTIRGRLQSVSDDGLVINSQNRQQMLAGQQILEVDVAKPSRRRHNVLIGLGVGAAAGAGLTLGATTGCSGTSCNLARGVLTAIGAVFVGGVGAIIGAVIPTGGWQGVYRR